jgi:hypothetical protein
MTSIEANFNEWYRADLFLAESDELAALKRAYEAGAASQAMTDKPHSAFDASRREFLAAKAATAIDLHASGGLASDRTLRDEFAGQALVPLIAENGVTLDNVGRLSYIVADAMLEARKTTGEGEA